MQLNLAADSKGSVDLYKIFDKANEHEPHLAFLQNGTLTSLRTLFSGTSDEVEAKLTTGALKIKWKAVLTDAIYFLRINDYREAPFFETSDKTKERLKTTMVSKGVAKAVNANVYGINEIDKYFKQFSVFESTLYGVDKYYRDHVIHPFNVWLTGLNVIGLYGDKFSIQTCNKSQVVKASSALKTWFEEDNGDEKPIENINLSTAELSAMWAIVALTHDIGYPLEKVDKVNDQLEKMLSHFGNIGFSRSRFNFENQHDHLVKFLLKLISSVCGPHRVNDVIKKGEWANHLRTKYYTKFSKSWEQFDHGIVSCLLLLKTLTFFIESDYCSEPNKSIKGEDARQFAIRCEILHAIASHTTPKIYHLFINNLSFLLIFCDDIQEWSRPTFNDIRAGMRGSAVSVDIDEFHVAQDDKDSDRISCTITYPELKEISAQESFVKRIFRQWFERLRPALGDQNRKFTFQWNVKFGGGNPWWFHLNNCEDNVFSKITMSGLNKDGEPEEMSLSDFDLE